MENTDATNAAIDPGAECQPILAGFQLGGEIFLLTFPFIERLTREEEIPGRLVGRRQPTTRSAPHVSRGKRSRTVHNSGDMARLVFHEKAGRCQVFCSTVSVNLLRSVLADWMKGDPAIQSLPFPLLRKLFRHRGRDPSRPSEASRRGALTGGRDAQNLAGGNGRRAAGQMPWLCGYGCGFRSDRPHVLPAAPASGVSALPQRDRGPCSRPAGRACGDGPLRHTQGRQSSKLVGATIWTSATRIPSPSNGPRMRILFSARLSDFANAFLAQHSSLLSQ